MNWLRKFFTTKVNLTQGNDSITAIEFDQNKNYVLIVKHGALTQREYDYLVQAMPRNVHVTWIS